VRITKLHIMGQACS